MRKETSTNAENEQLILESCAMSFTVSLISGRWKPLILWQLVHGKMRYSDLHRNIPGVSEKILSVQLRELERDGLVSRHVLAETPVRVEYTLSEKGWSLKDIFRTMSDWGKKNRPAQ